MYSSQCPRCKKRFYGTTPGLAEANMIRHGHGMAPEKKPTLTLHNRTPKLVAASTAATYAVPA